MAQADKLQQIREKISDDQFREAIDNFLQLATPVPEIHRAVLLQKSRFMRLQNDEMRGIVPRQEAEAEKNRIVDATLRLIEKLEEKEPIPEVTPISSQPDGTEEIADEKILGINNLRQIAWVARAVEVSRCVCRIIVDAPNGKRGYGTGFLIAPDVVMTNNHVIGSAEEAGNSIIEFNYQQAFRSGDEPTTRYYLDPTRFHTNKDLDYSLIGVLSDPAKPRLTYWGTVQLNPNADPLLYEHVSIIQHPNGGLKVIVMTTNQVTSLSSPFLRYTTDTMPGSSGAPIFNDLWQVVGIHHKWDKQSGYNEGILISCIHADAKGSNLWPVALGGDNE